MSISQLLQRSVALARPAMVQMMGSTCDIRRSSYVVDDRGNAVESFSSVWTGPCDVQYSDNEGGAVSKAVDDALRNRILVRIYFPHGTEVQGDDHIFADGVEYEVFGAPEESSDDLALTVIGQLVTVGR